MAVSGFQKPEDRWDAAHAATLDEPGRLLYRSNLLGGDLAITNFGGGNTSAKIDEVDPLTGKPVTVLWVKGSGGDLGSMGRDGFATLYLDKLLGLEGRYRGLAHEDEMVALFAHATFNLNPRAPSIDTPLHGFLPFRHIDHLHPDAVIALAASEGSRDLVRRVYGDSIAWLPWQRPGFDLGLKLRAAAAENPRAKGLVLEGHGLFTWGEDSESCYRNSIEVIGCAAAFLNDARQGRSAFGGWAVEPRPATERGELAARLLPRLRAAVSQGAHKVAHFDDSPEVLEFAGSADLAPLAALGTSCPDHFLRTKIRPLVLSPDADDAAIEAAVSAYRADYAAYYERCRRPDSPAMRDANPVVVLLPGLGLSTFAKDKPTARVSAEFYRNAINVMRGATSVGRYVGLPEQEAFDIEYWLLEEAKLKRMPPPKPLTGRVAYVSGGAGAIGSATAEALLGAGAVVMLVDRDGGALDDRRAVLAGRFGADAVRSMVADVTDEGQVLASFEATAREYGGLDILVANAGIASSASIEETTVELWRRNYDVLVEGYFLASREAFKLMKPLGGSIVFIASKNGLAASPNASAYASAKAAEVHLARCLALEGAPHGIRVNTVNPDAVLRGSRIWDGEWREERARAYGVAPDRLEDVYRNRSLLKRDVLPEDVAEAVLFFATDRSAKSTGNILNVDAGNAAAFTR